MKVKERLKNYALMSALQAFAAKSLLGGREDTAALKSFGLTGEVDILVLKPGERRKLDYSPDRKCSSVYAASGTVRIKSEDYDEISTPVRIVEVPHNPCEIVNESNTFAVVAVVVNERRVREDDTRASV